MTIIGIAPALCRLFFDSPPCGKVQSGSAVERSMHLSRTPNGSLTGIVRQEFPATKLSFEQLVQIVQLSGSSAQSVDVSISCQPTIDGYSATVHLPKRSICFSSVSLPILYAQLQSQLSSELFKAS